LPRNDLLRGGLATLALATALPAWAETTHETYRLTFGAFEGDETGGAFDFDQSGGEAEAEWRIGRLLLGTGLVVLRYDESSAYTIGTEVYATAGYRITPRLTAGTTLISYDLRTSGAFDPAPRTRVGAFAEYRGGAFDAVLYAETDPDVSGDDYIYLGSRYAPNGGNWSLAGSIAVYPDDSAAENTLRVTYTAEDWQATAFYYTFDASAGSDQTELGVYGRYDPSRLDRLRLYGGLRTGGFDGADDWRGLSLGVGYEVMPDGHLILGYDLRDARSVDYSERGITIGFEMDLGARGLLHQEMFTADSDDIRRTGGEWYD